MSRERDPRCMELFAVLSEYLDGELPAEASMEIETHFAGCAPCLEFLEQFRNSIRLTRDYCAEEKANPIPPQLRGALERAWEIALEKREAR